MTPAAERRIYLIDAIGPFFGGYDKTRINWSKIPWRHLKTEGEEAEAQFAVIREEMTRFVDRVAEEGFTAISLDDLPHLADHPHYEPEIRTRIQFFQRQFRVLFEIARRRGLQIFLTADIMSYTPDLKRRLATRKGAPQRAREFLSELLDSFFEEFPEVEGIIFRIGESDGLDVKDEFRSELLLKNPRTVNAFLRGLLPVFEKHERLCIFRTWTVGAHRIGDLIWHRNTLAVTIAGIDSPAFVLSMKYGESDFFRYLPLNRSFFRTAAPKIIELQTRREYEGCGEYPSFIGWDYQHFADELAGAENLIGISVWCQTGGWLPFRRRAYLDDDAIWTEINTFVTLKIFKDGLSVEEAVQSHPRCDDGAVWLELLRLSDEVVKELLYTPEFASQKLFFRRVRIPPLINVYWHNIFINHSLKKIMTHFTLDPERSIRSGYAALKKFDRMEALAGQCCLPQEDIVFMKETFRLLALAREYFLMPFDEEIRRRLKKAKKDYKALYPRDGARYRYAVKMDFKPFRMQARFINWACNVLLRNQRGYRVVDRILGLHLLSLGYLVLRKTRPKLIPKFARKSAMGIDAVFR